MIINQQTPSDAHSRPTPVDRAIPLNDHRFSRLKGQARRVHFHQRGPRLILQGYQIAGRIAPADDARKLQSKRRVPILLGQTVKFEHLGD